MLACVIVSLAVDRVEQSGIAGEGCKKHTLEFTDPTGTISKDPKFPLNTWVEFGGGGCAE